MHCPGESENEKKRLSNIIGSSQSSTFVACLAFKNVFLLSGGTYCTYSLKNVLILPHTEINVYSDLRMRGLE